MNNSEKTLPSLVQEAGEQPSSNEQTRAASGVKSLEEEELANVTGGAGIQDVLVNGYHSVPLRFYPEGGVKPLASTDLPRPKRGAWGGSPTTVTVLPFGIRQSKEQPGTFTLSEGSAFKKP